MKTTIANPVNTTNAMGKKRKRPKNMHKSKKDEENILSKDIEDDNIRYMMDTKKNIKPREDLKTTFTLKNLRFKPQKYKGSFLPYHLRWIFNNNVKTNEIVLLNEIEGLENEINRLKALKLLNRECRKLAGLPFGISTNFCQCCHLLEKKKHDCSHKYCNDNCPRKKAEELMNNLLKNNKLKELKENISKDKNLKKLFNDFNNNNINFSEQKNNDINNDKFNSSTNNEHKIILDKNLNNYNNNENNINDSNKMNNTPIKKRLIFGTVERSSIEKRSIFLVKSDNMNGNNSSGINEYESPIKNEKKNNNNYSEEDDDNNKKEDDDNEDEDEDEDELKNYTVSIESDGDDELEKIINIKNDNDEKNDNNNNNEEKSENESDNNNDKDNDEDDVIIINQTSPHQSDKEN